MEPIPGLGNLFAWQEPAEPDRPMSLFSDAVWWSGVHRPFVVVSLLLYRRPERFFVANWRPGYVFEGGELPAIELRVGETYDAAARRLCTNYLGFTPAADLRRYTEFGTYSVMATPLAEKSKSGRPVHIFAVTVAYRLRRQDAPHPNRQADGTPAIHDVFGLQGTWLTTSEVADPTVRYGQPLRQIAAGFLATVAG